MEIIFLVAVALISGVVLIRGISRAQAPRPRRRGKARVDGVNGKQSSSLKDFGEEELAQELRKLRVPQSAYDTFIDWLGQRCTFWMSKVLTASWLRSFTKVSEAAKAQTDFDRHIGERANIPRKIEKDASDLKADIAEQRRRKAKADYERKNLKNEPEAHRPESAEDLLRRKVEEFARGIGNIDDIEAEVIRSRTGGRPEEEWNAEEREWAARVRNFCDQERQRRMER